MDHVGHVVWSSNLIISIITVKLWCMVPVVYPRGTGAPRGSVRKRHALLANFQAKASRLGLRAYECQLQLVKERPENLP